MSISLTMNDFGEISTPTSPSTIMQSLKKMGSNFLGRIKKATAQEIIYISKSIDSSLNETNLLDHGPLVPEYVPLDVEKAPREHSFSNILTKIRKSTISKATALISATAITIGSLSFAGVGNALTEQVKQSAITYFDDYKAKRDLALGESIKKHLAEKTPTTHTTAIQRLAAIETTRHSQTTAVIYTPKQTPEKNKLNAIAPLATNTEKNKRIWLSPKELDLPYGVAASVFAKKLNEAMGNIVAHPDWKLLVSRDGKIIGEGKSETNAQGLWMNLPHDGLQFTLASSLEEAKNISNQQSITTANIKEENLSPITETLDLAIELKDKNTLSSSNHTEENIPALNPTEVATTIQAPVNDYHQVNYNDDTELLALHSKPALKALQQAYINSDLREKIENIFQNKITALDLLTTVIATETSGDIANHTLSLNSKVSRSIGDGVTSIGDFQASRDWVNKWHQTYSQRYGHDLRPISFAYDYSMKRKVRAIYREHLDPETARKHLAELDIRFDLDTMSNLVLLSTYETCLQFRTNIDGFNDLPIDDQLTFAMMGHNKGVSTTEDLARQYLNSRANNPSYSLSDFFRYMDNQFNRTGYPKYNTQDIQRRLSYATRLSSDNDTFVAFAPEEITLDEPVNEATYVESREDRLHRLVSYIPNTENRETILRKFATPEKIARGIIHYGKLASAGDEQAQANLEILTYFSELLDDSRIEITAEEVQARLATIVPTAERNAIGRQVAKSAFYNIITGITNTEQRERLINRFASDPLHNIISEISALQEKQATTEKEKASLERRKSICLAKVKTALSTGDNVTLNNLKEIISQLNQNIDLQTKTLSTLSSEIAKLTATQDIILAEIDRLETNHDKKIITSYTQQFRKAA